MIGCGRIAHSHARAIAALPQLGCITTVVDEASGVRALLEWARAGDLLVLPVHALDARDRAIALVQNWT